MTLTVATVDAEGPGTKLAPSTVNRILAAVSSFYEYVIMAGLLDRANPIDGSSKDKDETRRELIFG